MNLDIERQLLAFVQSASALEVAIDAETDLLHTNVLDSLLLMEMVIAVEHSWGVKLQGEDIAPRNFRSVRNLASLVASRQPDSNVEQAPA